MEYNEFIRTISIRIKNINNQNLNFKIIKYQSMKMFVTIVPITCIAGLKLKKLWIKIDGK